MTDLVDICLIYILAVAAVYLLVILVFLSIQNLVKFKAIPFCIFGLHKMHRYENGVRKANYFCSFCRKQRKFPKLRAIKGGRKFPMERM